MTTYLSISVVIPVRNDARLLELCLQALGEQTRRADEIIVVDNGSTDDTAAVAERYGARVVAEPVPGIPQAASAGYDAASGDIIGRLDADSRPGRDWIERIVQRFQSRPELDFLTGDPRFYGSTPLVRWMGEHLYIGGMYAVLTPFLGHAPLFGSNMAMRTDAWRMLSGEVHRNEQNIHDDFDLSFHIRPGMTVLRDRDLVVDVSARPFKDWASLRRRLSFVLPTVRLHMPQQAPHRRRQARRRARIGMPAAQ
ncbi:glycosyltransferase [Microbacterium murale]|uniref:Glycosyltransferase involved in cell wall biosynthesis n=1 Tax=Microbacterium murale TaxID=1081040 RepID=A0ABU0P3T9_9MICO|nr:glycosyltransferase family 2 protein [Microbacterium murale]MDQ0642004.1 glycosyltransferase involved in cell wall biosynthesis [Microbacterium murale]